MPFLVFPTCREDRLVVLTTSVKEPESELHNPLASKVSVNVLAMVGISLGKTVGIAGTMRKSGSMLESTEFGSDPRVQWWKTHRALKASR